MSDVRCTDENIKEGWMKAYEDIGMSEVAVLRLHQLDQLHLDLAHLLLPDLVVAVRDQILSHLGNNEGGSEIPIWKTNQVTSVRANASRA